MKDFAKIVFWIIIAWFLVGHIGSAGKYEGRSAEEWFNLYDAADARYQALMECVDGYAYTGEYNDLLQVQTCY